MKEVKHILEQAMLWSSRDISARYLPYFLSEEARRQRAIIRGIDAAISIRPAVNENVLALEKVIALIDSTGG